MFCNNCGNFIGDEEVCKRCKNIIKLSVPRQKNFPSNRFNNISLFKNKYIFIIGVLILIFVGFMIFNSERRVNIMKNMDQNSKLKITIDNVDFYLGDSVSSYLDKGYDYKKNNLSVIAPDSIILQPFYKDDNQKFLATLYCADNKECEYNDAQIIKINFYSQKNIVINDLIKLNTSYDEIVEKYGKETGKYYQDNNILVWSLGNGKIGEPYFALKFKKSYLYGKMLVSDIRIGIWWYEGEYEHVIEVENEK